MRWWCVLLVCVGGVCSLCHLTHHLFPSSATKYTVSLTPIPTPFWTGIYSFILVLFPFSCFPFLLHTAHFLEFPLRFPFDSVEYSSPLLLSLYLSWLLLRMILLAVPRSMAAALLWLTVGPVITGNGKGEAILNFHLRAFC